MDERRSLFHDVVAFAGGSMRIALISSALVLSLVACTKGEEAPSTTSPPTNAAPSTTTPPPIPTPGDAAPPPAEPPPIPPAVPGPVGEVLDAYENVRAKLADDDSAGALTYVDKIAASAKDAGSAAAAGPTAKPLADIAAAAEKMNGYKPAQMEEIRMAFGELSKATVALLVADPSLQTGRFLFLCPMAKGYQKWVQTTQKLQNPYWGKQMLDCGEELKAWSV
jgi:type IV secretory pathway VirB10-like protein